MIIGYGIERWLCAISWNDGTTNEYDFNDNDDLLAMEGLHLMTDNRQLWKGCQAGAVEFQPPKMWKKFQLSYETFRQKIQPAQY